MLPVPPVAFLPYQYSVPPVAGVAVRTCTPDWLAFEQYATSSGSGACGTAWNVTSIVFGAASQPFALL